MIESKDFVMRIINRIGAFLRQILKGQVDKASEAEVNEALEEIAGLPTSMLSSMSAGSIVTLLEKLPNYDVIALSGILLTIKARVTDDAKFAEAGRTLLEKTKGMTLSREVLASIAALEKQDGR